MFNACKSVTGHGVLHALHEVRVQRRTTVLLAGCAFSGAERREGGGEEVSKRGPETDPAVRRVDL